MTEEATMFIDQATGEPKCDLTEAEWTATRPVIVAGMQTALIHFSEALSTLTDDIPDGYKAQYLRACRAFVDSALRASTMRPGLRCEPCEKRKEALTDEIIAQVNAATAKVEAEVRASQD